MLQGSNQIQAKLLKEVDQTAQKGECRTVPKESIIDGKDEAILGSHGEITRAIIDENAFQNESVH